MGVWTRCLRVLSSGAAGIFALSSVAFAGCLDDARRELELALAAQRDNPAIYCVADCFVNSGELARQVTAQLGKIDPKELKILIVKNKNASVFGPLPTVKQMLVGRAARGGPAAWKYHAVLEYRGLILDLDLNEASVIPVHNYFKIMFPETTAFTKPPTTFWGRVRGMDKINANIPKELHIAEIPAAAYLDLAKQRPEGDNAVDIIHLTIREIPFKSIEGYLREKQVNTRTQ